MLGCLALVLTAAWLLTARVALAQGQVINEIQIEGNQRVETDAIRIHITQQAGQPYDKDVVNQDVKAIYKMGFFDDVHADIRNIGGKNVLVYIVKERPQVTDVRFGGMKAIRSTDDKIVAAMKVHPGAILDPTRVKESINGITSVYEDKG